MRQAEHKLTPNCLRKYRLALGLKQKQVAEILGMKTPSRISRWENGDCLPSALNVFRLSAIYSVMIEALFIDLVRSIRTEMKARADEALNRITSVHEGKDAGSPNSSSSSMPKDVARRPS